MKANRSSLWSENEKSFLENVTMDLIPDDDALNVKGKTVRKWDKVKKRYTLQKVDREGKVMKERRNESGAKVTNKSWAKDRNSAYKNWQSRTHLTLQKPGEMENKRLIAQAKTANEGRQMMKSFKRSHSDLNMGEDVRNPRTLIKNKTKRLQMKM